MAIDQAPLPSIPWFGARKLARSLQGEVRSLQAECDRLRKELKDLGGLTILEWIIALLTVVAIYTVYSRATRVPRDGELL